MTLAVKNDVIGLIWAPISELRREFERVVRAEWIRELPVLQRNRESITSVALRNRSPICGMESPKEESFELAKSVQRGPAGKRGLTGPDDRVHLGVRKFGGCLINPSRPQNGKRAVPERIQFLPLEHHRRTSILGRVEDLFPALIDLGERQGKRDRLVVGS